MLIFLIAPLLVLLLFLALRLHLKSSLNWPRKMSYYGFKSRVRWTLKRHGWSCADVELRPYPLMIRKGGATVMLVCLHTVDNMTRLTIADLDGNRDVVGLKQIVFVTADRFSEEFQSIALEKRIFVLHYKELKAFASIPSSNTKLLKQYFANSYANRRHVHAGDVDHVSTAAVLPGSKQLFASSRERT